MLLFLTFHGQGIRAQNQSWNMVPYQLNFTGGSVNAFINPALNNTYQSQFPSASVNDPFGNLLFSVSDGFVYNRSGTNAFAIQNPNYIGTLLPLHPLQAALPAITYMYLICRVASSCSKKCHRATVQLNWM
jgi:hypothetical protein